MMQEEMLTEIERINVIILVIGCMAATIIMREFRYVFSFGVGSAIMTLNFRFLRKGIEGVFQRVQQVGPAQSSGQESQQVGNQLIKQINKKALIVKLPLKFLALVTAVILVVLYGNIDVIFFLIGLSTVFISIVLSHISFALKPADERSKQHGA
ncbi:MAG TPA: hypothetical protein VKF36_14210 [Syntrophorhabdales bacterium]|nr:hypothetical protein [Syntrophorhabdales bacterium]